MNAIDLPAPEPLEVERVFARLETTRLKRHRDMLLAALPDDTNPRALEAHLSGIKRLLADAVTGR